MATNEYLDYTGLSRLKQKMDAAYGGGGGGSTQTVTASTVSASGWSNGYYSFESSWPSSQYNIQVDLYESTTAAQASAWQAAQIVGSVTNNRIKALGTVPTVDIPVMVTATTK